MSKAETLRQSAAASNAVRVAQLATGIEALKQARYQSAEELAAALEPIAQAMASLTDETRQTLAAIEARTRAQSEAFTQQLTMSSKSLTEATGHAQWAAERLQQTSNQLEWTHYALAVATGLVTAGLVSACWLWVAPPTVQNHLDAKAVAALLKPAVIEALKPSKGK